MTGDRPLSGPVHDAWRSTGLNGRLAIGVVGIVAFTIAWDLAGEAMGSRFPWPLTGLVAAAGWARLGLSIRPMTVLVLLGFAFDAVSLAPFGVYPLVFLSTYALLASAGIIMGGEMDPVLGTFLPHIGIALGVIVLWMFASILAGEAVEVLPLLIVWAMCALLYILFEWLFDLESAKTAAKGG